jgi:lysozyme family protein
MMQTLMDYASFANKLTKDQEIELDVFTKRYVLHKDRYEKVASKIDFPARLIAAIHWRESSGDFSTYLHQGDPLGKPCIHEPRFPAVPIFDIWEEAAEHALNQKKFIKDSLAIIKETFDYDILCSFAERYNGMGYRLRGVHSPYVLAGTEGYVSGKFVSDGNYSPYAIDKQLGVLPMLRALQEIV